MIKVEIQKKHVPNPSEDLMDIIVVTWNKAAEALAETIREKVEDLQCTEHPDKESILIIKSDGEKLSVDKNKFCCKKFADQIQFTGINES